MPELPELERIRRTLETRIIGKAIRAVAVTREECLNVPPAVFERAVVGRTVDHVWRKGKTVIIDLSYDVSLLIHLMLGGEVDAVPAESDDLGEAQVVLQFTDGSALRVSRLMLGNVHVFPSYHLAATRIGSLGPDALSELPDAPSLQAIYGTRARGMKVLLLDQSLVCGLGNFYADEVLFRARIHPETPGKALSARDCARLREAIESVIADALDEGRPDFDRQVFARPGEACNVCGSQIRMKPIQKRATHFCPKCQRRKSVRKKRS